MKVQCEYCDSYIEVDDTSVCPNCGASLSEAIRIAKEIQAKEEAEQAKIQAENEQKENTLDLIKDVAKGALIGSLIFGGLNSKNKPMHDMDPYHTKPMNRPGGPGFDRRPDGPGGAGGAGFSRGPGFGKGPGGKGIGPGKGTKGRPGGPR